MAKFKTASHYATLKASRQGIDKEWLSEKVRELASLETGAETILDRPPPNAAWQIRHTHIARLTREAQRLSFHTRPHILMYRVRVCMLRLFKQCSPQIPYENTQR